ncbi:MAG: hypothetical protein O7G87_09250 [bacterium]|nr:hypothetical protein [bacterium]
MTCETCGEAQTTQISTQIVDGTKKALYQCDACASGQTGQPKLERPCEQCGKREGTIKLVCLRGSARVVSYICQTCA